MSTKTDFIQDLREESKRPMPVSKTDLWEATTGTNAVVQRTLTAPLAGGAAAREIKLSAIRPDPNQPRRTMDPQSLQDLADSIRENGVLQPITVTWSESERVYLIVTGQRRYAASKIAGLESIPAVIRPIDYDERQRLQQQLVENIQREGIPPIEEATAIQHLMDTFELSQRAVAKRLGKPQTYVAELLQILRIPETLRNRAKGLPKQSLVQVSRVSDPQEQDALLSTALSSDAPYRTAKQERFARHPKARLVHFKRTLTVEGVPGTVTVDLEKHPNDVTADDLIDLLSAVTRRLMDEKRDEP